MITPAELARLKSADPKGVFPGINAAAGNPLATASLKSLSSITTNTAAPFYYNPANNQVYVKGAGTVLTGYNFGSAQIDVYADNVTINDCTFSNPSSTNANSVRQYYGHSGLTLENSTFLGGVGSSQTTSVLAAGYATIKGDKFLDTSGHGVQIDHGVISGNDFSGGGYGAGVHADAIQICDTTGPVTISGNMIDWTNNPDALEATNNAIRIATDVGNTSNVTVTGNVLLGGGYTVYAEPTKTVWLGAGSTGTLGATGRMTNVKISGNYIGFGAYGAFYPTPAAGVTDAGNTIIDDTNPLYSANAWAAYAKKGVGTQVLVTSSGSDIAGSAAGTTTLYGAGKAVHLFSRGLHETVFVGGAGAQSLVGGPGANIFKYLSAADSPGSGSQDVISGFDPAKDVIDLGAINANPGAIAGAATSFAFIGTSAFTAAGDEVRYHYNAANNMTYVEANMAGDMNYGQIGDFQDIGPDLVVRLAGNVSLTAANFALTPAQSAADMTAGANMIVTKTLIGSNTYETAYSNVKGRAYTAFAEITSGSAMVAEAFDNADGSGSLTLSGAKLTYSAGEKDPSVTTAAGSTAAVAAHSRETVHAGASGSETFAFGHGFGNTTIDGFAASGSAPDTLRLSISAFSYLAAGMTQAQDLAAIIAHGSNGGAGFTIQDSYRDTITLAGVTSATLAAHPGVFHFV